MKESIRMIEYMENEYLIERVAGNSHIDEDLNIVSDDNIFISVTNYMNYIHDFNDGIYIDGNNSYNSIKDFLSFAKINGYEDWRIPTISELQIILDSLWTRSLCLPDIGKQYNLRYELNGIDFLSFNNADSWMTTGIGINPRYLNDCNEVKFTSTAYQKDDIFCHFFIVR